MRKIAKCWHFITWQDEKTAETLLCQPTKDPPFQDISFKGHTET